MAKKNLDGKTYYYLLDDANLLHVCSDGFTSCGKDAKEFHQVMDDKLALYEVCSDCTAVRTKTATFETKAQIVEGPEPVTGKII